MLKKFREYYFKLDEIAILILRQVQQEERGTDAHQQAVLLQKWFLRGHRLLVLRIGDYLFDVGII